MPAALLDKQLEGGGGVTKTIQHGNCTIVIHRPDLTKAERARRERAVTDALETICKKENTQ